MEESRAQEPTEKRPWGEFYNLDESATHKVKRLHVKPGARLSLQYHHQREEHWVVLQGEPQLTVGERTWIAKKGDYVFVPKKAVHRISNAHSQEEAVISEVQHGEYCGEDDIVRLHDDYKRA